MKIILILTISLIANTIFAMQQTTIYIKSNQVMYIGAGEVRDRLEKIYGTKFPLDSVFFPIGFKNAPQGELPQFIAHTAIADCRENSSIDLELQGKKLTVICQQKNAEYAPDSAFHHARDFFKQQFLQHPNWLLSGEESLIKAGIIKPKN